MIALNFLLIKSSGSRDSRPSTNYTQTYITHTSHTHSEGVYLVKMTPHTRVLYVGGGPGSCSC